ncbi:MAG TPA: hypothetical protein VFB25_11895 [Gaiellaceae bacterium]|nr:hypothetical protein [Gaiellaceae bacterium]
MALLALVGAGAHAPRAAAATPCWKALLTDWYDGRIDNVYPIHCYTDALKHLPSDVQEYSSAHDDILRALQNAKAELRKEGKKVTANTPVPANNGGNSKRRTITPTTTSPTPPGSSSPGKHTNNLVDKLNPDSPSSLPLPLLILGALALLLVAAGAVGLVAKRLQGRKPAP